MPVLIFIETYIKYRYINDIYKLQVYLQNVRSKMPSDSDSAQSAWVQEHDAYLDELEKLALDLNMLAPSLSGVTSPTPGNHGDFQLKMPLVCLSLSTPPPKKV